MKAATLIIIAVFSFCNFVLAEAEITNSLAGNNQKIRVLIVDGFGNHDWKQTTLWIRKILALTGQFEVAVSTVPDKTNAPGWLLWRPQFTNYDVVIQTCNDNAHNGFLKGVFPNPQWPEPAKNDFRDFVQNGGGVYIFHSAQNAFVGWGDYESMVGLCWRNASYGTAIRIDETGRLVRIPPGQLGGTGHGKRETKLVTRLGDDPIHVGMPQAWLTPDLEVYFFARGPAENVRVLSYARDSKPGPGWLWPVEWTVEYGRGRVYVSTYGHVWAGDVNPASMRCAAVQTIIPRALQWLAKQPVTIPVPSDFPSTNAVSVRPAIPIPGKTVDP